MNGGAVEYNRILKSYNDTEDNQERKYAMFSLGSTNVESLRHKTLDWAVKSGDIKLQDIFYPIGAVASNVTGSELAWSYYKEVSFCFPSFLCFFLQIVINFCMIRCFNTELRFY